MTTRAAIGTATATTTPIPHSHGAARPATNAVSAAMPATTPHPTGAPRRVRGRASAIAAIASAVATMRTGMPVPMTPTSTRTAADDRPHVAQHRPVEGRCEEEQHRDDDRRERCQHRGRGVGGVRARRRPECRQITQSTPSACCARTVGDRDERDDAQRRRRSRRDARRDERGRRVAPSDRAPRRRRTATTGAMSSAYTGRSL